jgi:hypothetical protein
MKLRSYPVIAILLVFSCLFAACGEESASAGIPAETAPAQAAGSITVPAVSAAPSPTQTPLPTVKLEPAPTAPPTPTPSPIPTIGPYFEPTVRKSPWPEVCIEGSTIYFTAFADNCLTYRWQLEKDHLILDWEDMSSTFEGMIAAGINESYLVLGNVPLSLDGWSVRCAFIGSGNATVYSQSALITVEERTVKIHGKDRRTIKDTGNVSGFGAVIDFEGELWWIVEEYAGQTFTLRKNDTDPELGLEEVSFSVEEDGSVLLFIDGISYRGTVSPERLGGFSASAVVSEENSGEEKTIFFDYTPQSQRWETYEQIYLTIQLDFPVVPETQETQEQEEPVSPDAETAGPSEDLSGGEAPEDSSVSPDEPENELPIEYEPRIVELILTRVR